MTTGLTIRVLDHLTDDSRFLRTHVFVDEQGFTEEFDEIDDVAVHILAFDGEKAVANARTYYSADKGAWVIGRVAVLPDYRTRGVGALLMGAVENVIRDRGGDVAWLSSQEPVIGFYEKLGYVGHGELFLDQHCPHRWMSKTLRP